MLEEYKQNKEKKTREFTYYDMTDFTLDEIDEVCDKLEENHENFRIRHEYMLESFSWLVSIEGYTVDEDNNYHHDYILLYLPDNTVEEGFDMDYLHWIKENSKNEIEADHKLKDENS